MTQILETLGKIARTPARVPTLRFCLILLLTGGIFTACTWFLEWDTRVARAVYTPNADWAWWMRQYASYPVLVISLLSLAFLLLPWLRRKWPFWRRFAAVWLMSLLFGGGLMSQVILQDVVDRPRPRDSALVSDLASASLSGHSFPSGHATVAFMMLIPFFVLRGRFPKTALFFLVGGLTWGGVVGYSRMVAGAHFMTDVLWSGIFMLIYGAVFSAFYKGQKDISTLWTGGFLILTTLAVILFNKFTLNLRWEGDDATLPLTVDLPCKTYEVTDGGDLQVNVSLRGYGAPLSTLALARIDDTLYLQRWLGIYHSLSCHMNITSPNVNDIFIKAP